MATNKRNIPVYSGPSHKDVAAIIFASPPPKYPRANSTKPTISIKKPTATWNPISANVSPEKGTSKIKPTNSPKEILLEIVKDIASDIPA